MRVDLPVVSVLMLLHSGREGTMLKDFLSVRRGYDGNKGHTRGGTYACSHTPIFIIVLLSKYTSTQNTRLHKAQINIYVHSNTQIQEHAIQRYSLNEFSLKGKL